MKSTAILALLLTLVPLRASAETGSADSAEFPVELGSARSVAAVTSGEFAVDLRDKGGAASSGSAEFVLNTHTFSPGSLWVMGSQSVAAGSETPYQIVWVSGGTQTDVSRQVGYRFLSPPPPGTAFGPGVLYAGDVSAPTTVRVVFSYFDTNDHSQESAPFVRSPSPPACAAP